MKTQTITIRLPESDYLKLKSLSEKTGLSINKIIVDSMSAKLADKSKMQKMVDGYAVFFNR